MIPVDYFNTQYLLNLIKTFLLSGNGEMLCEMVQILLNFYKATKTEGEIKSIKLYQPVTSEVFSWYDSITSACPHYNRHSVDKQATIDYCIVLYKTYNTRTHKHTLPLDKIQFNRLVLKSCLSFTALSRRVSRRRTKHFLCMFCSCFLVLFVIKVLSKFFKLVMLQKEYS